MCCHYAHETRVAGPTLAVSKLRSNSVYNRRVAANWTGGRPSSNSAALASFWPGDDLKVDPLRLALLTVEGDSMEPTIRHEDLILVDLEQNRIQRDSIYVLRIDNALMAKRIQRGHDGSLHVISDNKAYKEFTLVKNELDSLEILGRVVWFGRQL